MGRIGEILLCLLVSSFLYADVSSHLNVTEEDGSPSTYPYKLKFANGTVTDNGDGTTSVSNSGGGGGGGDVFLASTQTFTGGNTFQNDVAVHPYDNVNDSNFEMGQWTFRQVSGDANIYMGRMVFQGESPAVTIQPNMGSGGELDVATLGINNLVLPLTVPGTYALTIGQQGFQCQNTDGHFIMQDLINNRPYLEVERDEGNFLWKAGNIKSSFGMTASTFTFTGASAPPNNQALCLSGGQVGHCTSIVGVGGGCTCVAP